MKLIKATLRYGTNQITYMEYNYDWYIDQHFIDLYGAELEKI